MNSRVYLINGEMIFGQMPRIEYYDYDLINEDGTSKLYRFEFSKEVFEKAHYYYTGIIDSSFSARRLRFIRAGRESIS